MRFPHHTETVVVMISCFLTKSCASLPNRAFMVSLVVVISVSYCGLLQFCSCQPIIISSNAKDVDILKWKLKGKILRMILL